MLQIYTDTVEEFWDWEAVENAGAVADNNSIVRFEQALAKFIGTDAVFSTPSARWGIQWLLGRLRRTSPKSTVFLSPFNCPVVFEAVESAGLIRAYYDFSAPNGQIDWFSVAADIARHENPGAVIVTHLFGVPVDFSPIIEICRKRNVFIIEDCAHTLGGMINSIHVGLLGDAAVFSFNYDKPISLGWGGALLLNNHSLVNEWVEASFPKPNIAQERLLINDFLSSMHVRRKCIGYGDSIRSRLMRRFRSFGYKKFKMPQLGIGPLRAELGRDLLSHYYEIVNSRINNAELIIQSCRNCQHWYVAPNVKPAWLKLKMTSNCHGSVGISKRLTSSGIRCGNFNWPSVLEPHLNSRTQAAATARYWFDVPVHQNLDQSHIDKIIDCVNW